MMDFTQRKYKWPINNKMINLDYDNTMQIKTVSFCKTDTNFTSFICTTLEMWKNNSGVLNWHNVFGWPFSFKLRSMY